MNIVGYCIHKWSIFYIIDILQHWIDLILQLQHTIHGTIFHNFGTSFCHIRWRIGCTLLHKTHKERLDYPSSTSILFSTFELNWNWKNLRLFALSSHFVLFNIFFFCFLSPVIRTVSDILLWSQLTGLLLLSILFSCISGRRRNYSGKRRQFRVVRWCRSYWFWTWNPKVPAMDVLAETSALN
jgi:hypothetical protein